MAVAGLVLGCGGSVALILLVLVWQFASVFKPLIVFGAIPFGLVGAVLGLVLTKTNFGFMAFLGVASPLAPRIRKSGTSAENPASRRSARVSSALAR